MHVALDKERVFLGVETAGNVLGKLFHGPAAQIRGILADGDGVKIRHKIVAVEFLRPILPVADRSKITAQSQIAAGLDAGEHDFFRFHIVHLCLQYFKLL